MAKILIVVKGGLVEEVYSTRRGDKATVIDRDHEGHDPADLVKVVLPGSVEYEWSNPPWEEEVTLWNGELPTRNPQGIELQEL